VSDARTFLTSDCDMPNCRVICDGLMPALSAARTALTWPRVNETFATSVCSLCLDDDCFGTGASVELGKTLVGSNRPRRSISDHIGREKVGCCWLSAVRPHAVNHAAIHISKQPKPVISPQAAPSERSQKATPSAKLGAKVPHSYGLSAGPAAGGGGPEVSGAFTPQI
jgi:hypothetical protein